MNCNELKEYISAYVDDELNQTQRDFVEAHLTKCRDCQAVLAEYRAARETLTSLRATPPMPDIKEATMARVTTNRLLEKPHRWLKPAIVAVPVLAAVAITLSLVFSGSPLTPEEVLAKSDTVIQHISTMVQTITYENLNQSTQIWEENMKETTLVEKDSRFGENYNYHWKHIIEPIGETEVIYFNGVHFYRYTPVYPSNILTEQLQLTIQAYGKAIENGSFIFVNTKTSMLNILSTSLKNVIQLSDESIDGFPCFHYQANTLLADEEDKPIDIWIDQSNYVIRLMIWYFDIPVSESQQKILNRPPVIFSRMIINFTYSNESVTIDPPLDAAGNLLPNWYIYSEQE